MRNTSFLQTQTILKALEFTLAKGGYAGKAKLKKAAMVLVKEMKSTKSIAGRHRQLTGMLKKGTTIDQMIKSTGASRRTIFRYLNHFEDAGFDVIIEDGKYKLK